MLGNLRKPSLKDKIMALAKKETKAISKGRRKQPKKRK